MVFSTDKKHGRQNRQNCLTSERNVDVEIETFLLLFFEERHQSLPVVERRQRQALFQPVDVGQSLGTDRPVLECHRPILRVS